MEHLTTADGLRLHLRRWPAAGALNPPRGTVQIVHGLGEHIGRYAPVAAALNAAGWQVAGHDQRGHGLSGGARGTIASSRSLLEDLALVMDHLRGPGRHVLLGHSLGGLIAARFAAERLALAPAPFARDFDALVLSSPALAFEIGAVNRLLLPLLARLAPNLRRGNGLRPEWVSRDAEVVRAYVADPLVHDRVTPRLARFIVDAATAVQGVAARWELPTLLLWAEADRCVLPAGSARFAAAAPHARLSAKSYPGLFHEIFNEPERDAVLADLTQWLARF